MQNNQLFYSDGSGNTYKLSKDSLIYIPVTPEMSSSGHYSGGEPVNKGITGSEFFEVMEIFENIFKNNEIQINDRIMTSGLLSIEWPNKKTQTVIIKPSNEKDRLEALLRKLKSGK